jgi:hypothetical protein
MRVCGYRVSVAALAAILSSPLHGQVPDATQVLAATREALGGEKKLAGVKTFNATGRIRQIRGNNMVAIEVEINCELPDAFVRRDEIPAQDSEPTLTGFKGDEIIQFPAPGAGRGAGRGAPPPGGPPAPPGGRGEVPAGERGRGGPPANPAQQRLATVKQDFARLTLGMFAASYSSYPLTFKYAAQGQAPEGVADILDVTGPSNFSARLVVQRDTRLPVMLMWQQPATSVIVKPQGSPAPPVVPPGSVVVEAPAAPPDTASQEDRDRYAAATEELRKQALAKPVEYRIYYADYRDVDGVKLPFRIRRAVGAETIEEMTFDRIRINAKIDPRKFDTPK